jgi:hypothetical protein
MQEAAVAEDEHAEGAFRAEAFPWLTPAFESQFPGAEIYALDRIIKAVATGASPSQVESLVLEAALIRYFILSAQD